ncbi:hypothetical protein Acr_00g0001370 [Actinidia rufa]|uniref:Uncharacterized protein n=1 Tax=Actinidia rufa TaxID=165716 RepID=A0A7J0D782_9ERIC|nr:hypothetical protein Acr_00g0001350 [Actinidia rufa]GFS28373.1 hypothetical protein Acr_00g0001370 [Actinidia rufa]
MKSLRLQSKLPNSKRAVVSPEEKLGGNDRDLISMREFREAIDKCALIDLGMTGGVFTWTNKRTGLAHIQSRLDRFLANGSWKAPPPINPSSDVSKIWLEEVIQDSGLLRIRGTPALFLFRKLQS